MDRARYGYFVGGANSVLAWNGLFYDHVNDQLEGEMTQCSRNLTNVLSYREWR